MKNCIICGAVLNADNTTWYRQKNYIHKCNDCDRAEKTNQAREKRRKDPSAANERSRKHREKVKTQNPVKYTCEQMRSSATKRAKALGFDLDITTDYLSSIAPHNCEILGIKLKYGGGIKTKASASLDRMNPKFGYIIGNVQIISNLANMMKNEASSDELSMFAEWVMRSHDKRFKVDSKDIK